LERHLQPAKGSDVQLLGTIVRLQYQRGHLKIPGAGSRFKRYDPANIVTTDELRFTPDGPETGPVDAPVYDVHHRLHSDSRNRGDNGVSLNITGHYELMREKLGERIDEGVAGENILIDYPGLIAEADLAGGLIVETRDGPAYIDGIIVATPCVEFSRYALDYPADQPPNRLVADTVAFLNEGVRGFYATMREPAKLRVGDRVFRPA
jgi:hypothetical protein